MLKKNNHITNQWGKNYNNNSIKKSSKSEKKVNHVNFVRKKVNQITFYWESQSRKFYREKVNHANFIEKSQNVNFIGKKNCYHGNCTCKSSNVHAWKR